MSLLSVAGLSVSYGPIRAVQDVSLDVRQGELVALLGANGAGKTSIARAIAGLIPYAGRVSFSGKQFPRTPEGIVGCGLSLVPEGRGILSKLSVMENLLLGAYTRRDVPTVRRELAAFAERFPVLGRRRNAPAGLLSGGEQQILAIVRALLSKPRILVLDEPSLGLAPLTTAAVFDLMAELREQGLSLLVAEQKARQVLKMADRAYLLAHGALVASGCPAELSEGDVLREAFLGGPLGRAEGEPSASARSGPVPRSQSADLDPTTRPSASRSN